MKYFLIISIVIAYFVRPDWFESILEFTKSLDKETLAAIVGAMITAFGGIYAVIVSQNKSKQRSVDETHRSKKVEIYKAFLDVLSGMISKSNEDITKNGLSDQELIDLYGGT